MKRFQEIAAHLLFLIATLSAFHITKNYVLDQHKVDLQNLKPTRINTETGMFHPGMNFGGFTPSNSTISLPPNQWSISNDADNARFNPQARRTRRDIRQAVYGLGSIAV
ncbi:MAG TPA: hypothetical protein PKD64_17270 [Pirellulaceae bacterium]|nr:hypothetical protein [Pirellulaceae bacterium]HMO93939.1 hypothetical protein [Pirellulaceae bacterium]HMP69750.1 hypothetical protein [Pirellulaceae bacterium]